jgi:hypothetical protein
MNEDIEDCALKHTLSVTGAFHLFVRRQGFNSTLRKIESSK